MPVVFSDAGYALNQGRVFIAERERDGPLLTGFDHVGDADQVELSVSQKTETFKNLFTGRGETIGNPVVEISCSLRIEALDMRLKNWATATWGDFPGAQPAGSVTSEAVTLFNGHLAKLDHIGVSNLIVAGAVLGVDYVVDSAAHGLLRVLPGSTAAPAGTPFATTASYDYVANLGKVEALVSGQKFYQVLVAGINVAQGNQPTLLRVRQVQLEMAKKFDVIAKRHMVFELDGEMLPDATLPVPSLPGDLSRHFSFEKA